MNINKAKLMQDLKKVMNDTLYTDGYRSGAQWIHNGLKMGEWDDVEDSGSEMKSLQERLEHKDKQIEWLVRDFAEMRNERDKYKQDVVGLRRGNEILHKKINELTGNLDEHRAALKQSEGRGDILVRDLQQTNEHWHREIGASEKKRMQLESDIKSYQEQIDRLQAKNMDLHRKVQGLLAPSPCEDADDNTVLRVRITELEEFVESDKKQLNKLYSDRASLEKQLEECEAMSENRFYQAVEWQNERDALRESNQDLRVIIEKLEERETNLTDRLSLIKKALE